MTKVTTDPKYAEAKFLLKNAGKLQAERLNESAKMCTRFALLFAERLIREKRTLSAKEITELSRECRGWHKEARAYDKAETESMIADMLDRLDTLENALNDDLDDELDFKVAK